MHPTNMSEGTWLNPPENIESNAAGTFVTAQENSDFWRTTSYGFIHDSGHALLNDFPQDSAIEVSWILNYDQQFDQAGLMVWSDQKHWIKAGVEFADAAPQLGAVVTNEYSDWSVAPVAEWMNKEVHLRISRSGDALTIRARCDGEWQLVRLAPLDPNKQWSAGIHLASPTRSGLTVQFTSLTRDNPDARLH
jgi:regulation of enolase protein 1 (concanavalin A-like superfamily)